MHTGQLFSDWLGWLCNDRDEEGKKKRLEATMDVVCRELSAAGVSAKQQQKGAAVQVCLGRDSSLSWAGLKFVLGGTQVCLGWDSVDDHHTHHAWRSWLAFRALKSFTGSGPLAAPVSSREA